MITQFKIFESARNLYELKDIIKCNDFDIDNDYIVEGFYEIIDLYYESDNFEDKYGKIHPGYKYDIKNLITGREIWNIDEEKLDENSRIATEEEYNLYKNTKKYNI